MPQVIEVGHEAMRPKPVGATADLELKDAELDADLQNHAAVAGADFGARCSPGSGSYGHPWITSSKSRRIALSRPDARRTERSPFSHCPGTHSDQYNQPLPRWPPIRVSPVNYSTEAHFLITSTAGQWEKPT